MPVAELEREPEPKPEQELEQELELEPEWEPEPELELVWGLALAQTVAPTRAESGGLDPRSLDTVHPPVPPTLRPTRYRRMNT